VSWSIVQDFAGIVLIVVLGTVAGDNGGGSLGRDALIAGLKATAFVAAVLILGLRVVPIVLNQVAEERSRELFFLAIAAMAIGTALASEYAGLSLALGAFLAGIVVSELDLSHRVLGELMPARDVFAVLFFVAAGMLIEPSVIVEQWATVVVLVTLIAVFKLALTGAIYRYGLAASMRTSLLGAAVLVPVGEYAFLLANEGVNTGALSEDAFGIILSSAVISIIISPLLVSAMDMLASRRGYATPTEVREPPPSLRVGRKAVICGFERPGQIVASLVAPRFDVVIFESNHKLATQARERGYQVVESSSVTPTLLDQLDLADARVLVITLADPFMTRLLAESARGVNPHLDIIASADGPAEVEKLQRSGITQAVVGDDEAALELARHSLHRFGVSSQESLAVIQRYRARMRTAT
jgi:CPA2 family monovalent cation:H+ antiporter-2